MSQNTPRARCTLPEVWLDSRLLCVGTRCAHAHDVLGISESLVTFVDGAGGALSLVEFRLPSQCRILESLVGALAAIGVQIMHIRVRTHDDHLNHSLRVAECDGSAVGTPRRSEVQRVLTGLVERALANVRRPIVKSRPRSQTATPVGSPARVVP